jgi:hypothetical protein
VGICDSGINWPNQAQKNPTFVEKKIAQNWDLIISDIMEYYRYNKKNLLRNITENYGPKFSPSLPKGYGPNFSPSLPKGTQCPNNCMRVGGQKEGYK